MTTVHQFEISFEDVNVMIQDWTKDTMTNSHVLVEQEVEHKHEEHEAGREPFSYYVETYSHTISDIDYGKPVEDGNVRS
jgi:CO dehydrogenase/acetyl-CoA synthase delta subunit